MKNSLALPVAVVHQEQEKVSVSLRLQVATSRMFLDQYISLLFSAGSGGGGIINRDKRLGGYTCSKPGPARARGRGRGGRRGGRNKGLLEPLSLQLTWRTQDDVKSKKRKQPTNSVQ